MISTMEYQLTEKNAIERIIELELSGDDRVLFDVS